MYVRGSKPVEETIYLNDIPYCDTASKPDFQTSVTSQALVAWSRQDRNADTALPPTIRYLLALLAMTDLELEDQYVVLMCSFPKGDGKLLHNC